MKGDAKVMKVSEKSAEKQADAKKDAREDTRDAQYKVAVEKCDAMSGAAKDQCVKQAKVHYGRRNRHIAELWRRPAVRPGRFRGRSGIASARRILDRVGPRADGAAGLRGAGSSVLAVRRSCSSGPALEAE